VRMMVPKLYAWKSAKWLKRITLMESDRSGYWELRGYSDTARPWEDDRFQ
jgi:DMSO/TMAO reductase YedYZ molybdopterin-dependent catalytic subunit